LFRQALLEPVVEGKLASEIDSFVTCALKLSRWKYLDFHSPNSGFDWEVWWNSIAYQMLTSRWLVMTFLQR